MNSLNNYKNILLITASFDRTADYFIQKYKKLANFIRINTDEFLQYEFSIKYSNKNFEVSIFDKKLMNEIHFSKIYSIYYRKPYYPKYMQEYSEYKEFLQREFTSFLIGMVENFKGKILTNPLILKKAENKLIQLDIAKKVGFKIPKTLITNSKRKADINIEPYKWIVKPLSYGKLGKKIIYTNLVRDKNFEGIDLVPVYFQKYIRKQFELRLTVINKKFFPVKIISSNNEDWRKGENTYSTIEIPNKLENKCLNYMKLLDLNFCAFDFIFDGTDYYFLEGNPNGQWLWLEKILSLKISEEIFNFLNS